MTESRFTAMTLHDSRNTIPRARRIRRAYQARSIRAGIATARKHESYPQGWIDWMQPLLESKCSD